MRKTLLAAVILLATQSGWAGIQYEFVQNTKSDMQHMPPTQLMGRAVIEGDRSRVDFISGNIYAPGAYVISTNGSKTLSFVDPVSKSYSEINAVAVAASYGARNVTVANLKTNLQKLPDTQTIAGIPTSHYHLTITYDLTIMYGSMPIRQSVREDIEKWTTTQFGDIAETFLANGGVRTGNPELDKVIDAETTLIKGFPLRQRTIIRTTNERGPLPGSKLELPLIRTQQRDLQISSIKRVNVDDKVFLIPSNFQKVQATEQPAATRQPQVTILNFEPQPGQPNQ